MNLKKTLEKVTLSECSVQVFGLGYVGFPLSIRLATSGFKVIGIDTSQKKIDDLKKNSLRESHLSLKVAFLESLKNGHLVLSEKSIKSELPRIGIICVPTPVDGKNDSNVFVHSAANSFLQTSKEGDIIILESSVKVGTTQEIRQVIESKGYKVGENYGLCFCPERIDPLNQKWKLENIPRIIYCSDDVSFQIAQRIYHHVNNSNLTRVKSAEIAEVVKSFENAFRLVNISLVNELAILCDKLQISVKEVIDAASTKPFGFVPFYTGAGAGGHCIPKDPTFLFESAKKLGVDFHSIKNAIMINSRMPKYIVDSIEKSLDELKLKKSVLVCGLSYKPNIGDMRDSAGFKILNELYQRKFKVGGYDPYFKDELLNEYLVENHLEKLDFKKLSSLDDISIGEYSCLCVVQHHTKAKFRIKEIYMHSQVPLIYDCQNKISYDSNSKTVLKGLAIAESSIAKQPF